MFHKVIQDNQLFVYWRGVLIYKRWLRLGYGIVFDKIRPFKPCHRDKETQ